MTPSSSFTTLKLQDDGSNNKQPPPPLSFGDVAEQGPSSSSILPTLYHVRRTISSPIVQTLVELGLAHTTVRIVELSFTDLKSPEYRQRVNPMGTSPAFCDHDNVQMWESGAILDYLLEMYDPHGQYWCSPGSIHHKDRPQQQHRQQEQQRRAKYLQLKQYLIATVYPLVAAWYLRRREQQQQQEGGKQQPRPEQQQPPTVVDDADDERARETFRTVIGPYLTRCLGDGPYFMDDQFTVLDLIAAKPFTNLHQLGELAAFPLLQAHFDRISCRPSYQEAYNGRDAAVRTPTTTPEILPVGSSPLVSGTVAAARSLAVARVSWCAGEVPAVMTTNHNNKKQRTGSITATTTTTTAAPCHALAVTTTTTTVPPPPPPAIRS
jgi:glutathione S-transferase